jgi:hypothetical protein
MQVQSRSEDTAPLILVSSLDTGGQHQFSADLPLKMAQYMFLSNGSLSFWIGLNGYGKDKICYFHQGSKLEISRLWRFAMPTALSRLHR